MSQARLTQGPRRGSDVVVLVSASHTRMCGPAAAEHELRKGSAVAIAAPPSSHRRPSCAMGQLPEDAAIGEEAPGQNFECDVNFSVDEDGVTPVVRIIHHGPSSYVEMLDNEAHTSRHSMSPQQHMLMSRSPSPHSRSSSPFSRPPTPIARSSTPKFRAMSPQQAARLSSFRAMSSGIIRSPMPPRYTHQAQVCPYASQKQGRSGSWHHGRSLPPSLPQSRTTLIKIMEECMLCSQKNMAKNERAHQPGSRNQLQKWGGAMDVARLTTSASGCSASAAAAIVAAAASAAGIHLEANGSQLQPCLDCLEEFVRRERVKKGESLAASVEKKEKVEQKEGKHHKEETHHKGETHHKEGKHHKEETHHKEGHPQQDETHRKDGKQQLSLSSSPPQASNTTEVLKTTLSSDGSTTEIEVSTRTENVLACAATKGTSEVTTGHAARPGHGALHGHHTSQHGHHPPPAGHHASPPGHHKTPASHCMSAPGHHTSAPGYHMSAHGHHASPPGHNLPVPSQNHSAPGHNHPPHGHRASRTGQTSQFGRTTSSDSFSTVPTSAQSPAPYRCPFCHVCICCDPMQTNSKA
ncbi:uncharacterized protein LOC142764993 [Rhipicephalus microplus]|uniref:uncharacterized protein LOC142764993 n=1 Tax=Rhipicephalus microplus TaxID=6941 RepID=UPI002376BFEE